MADDLKFKMIMALNAADLGSPMCEQVASVCAEIAEQHCTALHRDGEGRTGEGVPVIDMSHGAPADSARSARAFVEELP